MVALLRLVTCSLVVGTVVLSACTPQVPSGFAGYVESDVLYLAAPQAGYLQALPVQRGSRVGSGQALFAVAPDTDAAALDQAQAQAQSAQGRLHNLEQPRRSAEIAALEAQVQGAEAALALSRIRLKQQQALAQAQFIAPLALDEARNALVQAQAQLEALNQQLAQARSSLGRPAELRGAQADVLAAQAQVAQKRWVVDRKSVSAPAAGEVLDTYYRPGEWVPAGAPVASLLPEGGIKLRFFVPETQLAQVQLGQAVQARCDGCPAPVSAKIDFIAPQAEYTPPVIYSRGSREKLVFRVEARPDGAQALRLHPGLPVDVQLTGH